MKYKSFSDFFNDPNSDVIGLFEEAARNANEEQRKMMEKVKSKRLLDNQKEG